ncbi:hypothetical protein ABTZ58_39560 [Streptomyces sp. NPDC094143]|uniref:hypothetical protein n=1 Tax=Streptomyces sp. NPDC094143 TaxID=3155310 RepID=UPI003320A317
MSKKSATSLISTNRATGSSIRLCATVMNAAGRRSGRPPGCRLTRSITRERSSRHAHGGRWGRPQPLGDLFGITERTAMQYVGVVHPEKIPSFPGDG